jgi:hypothetical protein
VADVWARAGVRQMSSVPSEVNCSWRRVMLDAVLAVNAAKFTYTAGTCSWALRQIQHSVRHMPCCVLVWRR